MMLLNDETYSEKVIESLPPTDTVEKFALYYYSLKLISTCQQKETVFAKLTSIDENERNTIFTKLPSEV